MKTENVFTGWVIRFGGLIPTFYVKDNLLTCHSSEAKVFMHKDQAEEKAKDLQQEYSCGVSVRKAD